MKKLAVVSIVWFGLVAGLLAVAVANRPGHTVIFTPGAGVTGLDRLRNGTSKDVSAALLDAWSSTYTLVLVLGTIALLVVLAVVSTRNQGTTR